MLGSVEGTGQLWACDWQAPASLALPRVVPLACCPPPTPRGSCRLRGSGQAPCPGPGLPRPSMIWLVSFLATALRRQGPATLLSGPRTCQTFLPWPWCQQFPLPGMFSSACQTHVWKASLTKPPRRSITTRSLLYASHRTAAPKTVTRSLFQSALHSDVPVALFLVPLGILEMSSPERTAALLSTVTR